MCLETSQEASAGLIPDPLIPSSMGSWRSGPWPEQSSIQLVLDWRRLGVEARSGLVCGVLGCPLGQFCKWETQSRLVSNSAHLGCCFQERGLFLQVIIYRINEDAAFHWIISAINTDCKLTVGNGMCHIPSSCHS